MFDVSTTRTNDSFYSLSGQNIAIKIHATAKYLRLAYNSKHRQFRLTCPQWTQSADINEFLQRAQPWIEGKLKTLDKEVYFGHGGMLPVFGKACRIHFQKDLKKSVCFHEQDIIVQHPRSDFLTLLADSVQKQALKVLSEKAFFYAEKLGVKIQRITIKDTCSRWGSCTWDGKLAFSWRLIFAPMEVAEYVCAHEVAHLHHFDHSPAFWQAVAGLCPDYKKLRRWLRCRGRQLFAYNFENKSDFGKGQAFQ